MAFTTHREINDRPMTIPEALWVACMRCKKDKNGRCHHCDKQLRFEGMRFCDQGCSDEFDAGLRQEWQSRHPAL